MKTFQIYLATMEHKSTRAINRGRVTMRDDGFVIDTDGDETPVEDFGMYITREEPFPPTDSDELFQIFIDLMAGDE